MSPGNSCEIKISDRIYYVNFEEVIQKIEKGTILRHDQIKFGNSDWIEVESVPEFFEVFEVSEQKNRLPDDAELENIYTNFQIPEASYKLLDDPEPTNEKCCAIHAECPPFFICTVCENLFCKDCPTIVAGNVKICPFCGGKCVLYAGQIWQFEDKKVETTYHLEAEKPETFDKEIEYVYAKLRLKDFFKALVYPFYFPLGLLIGGGLFSVLIFGEIVTLFRGDSMFLTSLAILSVIMMLKFGILAKSFENFSQNDFKISYMPHLKKFTIYEDFISPFLLGMKAYLVSFGLFGGLVILLGFYAWFSYSANADAVETEMLKTGEKLNTKINSIKSDTKINKLEENELRKMINQERLNRMEKVFGNNHLVENKQLEKLIKSVMNLTVLFQMPVCFAFILGVIFFPAVCLTTGENHFLTIKQRFVFGFKEMKKIGFDYVKILFMCLLLLLFSAAAFYGLNYLFAYFEMLIAGMFLSVIAASFLIFYFWVVFSGILSITLTKRTNI